MCLGDDFDGLPQVLGHIQLMAVEQDRVSSPRLEDLDSTTRSSARSGLVPVVVAPAPGGPCRTAELASGAGGQA